MGGSKRYEGNANMTSAHRRLAREMDMRMEHFDVVLEHLAASLQDLNVPQVMLLPCKLHRPRHPSLGRKKIQVV